MRFGERAAAMFMWEVGDLSSNNVRIPRISEMCWVDERATCVMAAGGRGVEGEGGRWEEGNAKYYDFQDGGF